MASLSVRPWTNTQLCSILGAGSDLLPDGTVAARGAGNAARFFFVYPYSYTAFLDYGGALFIRVSRPLSARGGTLQTPLCPPPRPVPRRHDTY